jgi:hypothetical protein
MSGLLVVAETHFSTTAVALLVVAVISSAAFVVYFAIRWAATFLRLPSPGPETSDLGPEPPAIVNLLVNRCRVTRDAAAATLIDLAARRYLELFEAAPGKIVVRLRGERTDVLTEYDEQVLALVRERADGGSAPFEAIQLDETQTVSWHERFAESVVADAESRGFLRGRWSRVDWVVFGALTASAFLGFAGAFYLAQVRRNGQATSDGFGRGAWFVLAAFAWLIVMTILRHFRSIRFSADGKAVTARWLGVKRFLQHSASFGETSPAGVAIWNRLLAYGAALGVARNAAVALPLEEEDPALAWSRVGGDWHQVRVDYPTRFGYGEKALPVLVNGTVRAAFWGAIAFFLVPPVLDFVVNVGSDVPDGLSSIWNLGIVAVFGLAFLAMTAFLAARVTDGVIRMYRGARDLTARETVEGEVVKHHRVGAASWFAVDPGNVDAVRACRPGDDGTLPVRGTRVRVVLTPHLHHVVSVELA